MSKKESLGVKIILGSEKRHKEPCRLKNELCLPCNYSKFFMSQKNYMSNNSKCSALDYIVLLQNTTTVSSWFIP